MGPLVLVLGIATPGLPTAPEAAARVRPGQFRETRTAKVWLVNDPARPRTSLVRRLQRRVVLEVLAVDRGWLAVETVDGRREQGFVLKALTKKASARMLARAAAARELAVSGDESRPLRPTPNSIAGKLTWLVRDPLQPRATLRRRLEVGRTVLPLARRGPWVKVETGILRGWVLARNLSAEPELAPAPPQPTAPKPAPVRDVAPVQAAPPPAPAVEAKSAPMPQPAPVEPAAASAPPPVPLQLEAPAPPVEAPALASSGAVVAPTEEAPQAAEGALAVSPTLLAGGVVLLVGFVVLLLFRRRKRSEGATLLRELERIRVSPDAEVALGEAAGRLLVIGNHRKGVKLLCELPAA